MSTQAKQIERMGERIEELRAERDLWKLRASGLGVIAHDFCEENGALGPDCGECWPCVADLYANLPHTAEALGLTP